MFPRLIHVAACVSMSLISDVPLHGSVSFYLSVHWFLDTWVVFLLGLSGITLLWTCMCKSLCGPKLSFPSGVYLRVELLGRVVVLAFIFLRKLHFVFHSGCTSLHYSHQQCRSIPFSACSRQHWSLAFLMIGMLKG